MRHPSTIIWISVWFIRPMIRTLIQELKIQEWFQNIAIRKAKKLSSFLDIALFARKQSSRPIFFIIKRLAKDYRKFSQNLKCKKHNSYRLWTSKSVKSKNKWGKSWMKSKPNRPPISFHFSKTKFWNGLGLLTSNQPSTNQPNLSKLWQNKKILIQSSKVQS